MKGYVIQNKYKEYLCYGNHFKELFLQAIIFETFQQANDFKNPDQTIVPIEINLIKESNEGS